MLADDVAYVIGVDTDADSHALSVLDRRTQRTCHALTVSASRVGYRRALRLARRHAPGRRVWALEGTGSYGAGLTRFLADRGEQVLEVERPRREGSRGRLKSDALDAERAARLLLSGQRGGSPRLGAETRALRALLVARESAVNERTAAGNQLRALVVTCPTQLRERLQARPPARWHRPRAGRPLPRPALTRTSNPAPARGGRPTRTRARPPRTSTRPAAPRPPRCRARLRSLAARLLVATGTPALGSGLRPPRRRRPHPRQLREGRPSPPGPWRRPAPEPSPAHHRPLAPPHRPPHQDLHRPSRRREQQRARRRPLPQALPRTLPLPPTGGDAQDLTLIEASLHERYRGKPHECVPSSCRLRAAARRSGNPGRGS